MTACTEYTIADGGRARWISEKVASSPWRKAFEVKGVLTDAGKRAILLHACLEDLRDKGFCTLPMVLDKSHFEGALRPLDRACLHETVYRTHCVECGECFVRFRRTDKEREVRVATVLEQGFKTRTVTINCAAWGTLMHLPRLWLFSLLGRCPEIPSLYRLGKARSPVGTLQRGLKAFAEGKEPWEINSLDLSSATDNFSKSLCSALYEGFTDRCPQLIRELGRETFRPVTLIYPPRGKVAEARVRSTQRGILMGDPTSWAVLNLHNIFLWRLAKEIDAYTGLVLKAELSMLGAFKVPNTEPGEKYVIRCGDDQLAVDTVQRCRNFEALLNSVGAVISVGAHFASKEWGYYTKVIFRVSDGKVAPYDKLPARFLTGPQRTRPGERQIPPWWNIGPAIETGLSWFKAGVPERVNEVDAAPWIAGYLNRGRVREMIKLGIEPFLPRELGGFGLISARGKFLAISGRGKAVWDALLRDDVSIKAFLLLHLASFIWSLDDSKKVASMVQDTVLFFREYYPSALDGFKGSRAEKVFGDPGNPLGIARDPELPFSLTDVLNRFGAGSFPLYEASSGPDQRTPALWKIGQRFKRFADAIRTPYKARHHELAWQDVRAVISRASEWRAGKAPNPVMVELVQGIRKIIPTDTRYDRKGARKRRLHIDFVPSPDLQRILRAAGVRFPGTPEEAEKAVQANIERRETEPIYFGIRITSFEAILHAPPSPGTFDPRNVMVEDSIMPVPWAREEADPRDSDAEHKE
jgi:hypothetical protein